MAAWMCKHSEDDLNWRGDRPGVKQIKEVVNLKPKWGAAIAICKELDATAEVVKPETCILKGRVIGIQIHTPMEKVLLAVSVYVPAGSHKEEFYTTLTEWINICRSSHTIVMGGTGMPQSDRKTKREVCMY